MLNFPLVIIINCIRAMPEQNAWQTKGGQCTAKSNTYITCANENFLIHEQPCFFSVPKIALSNRKQRYLTPSPRLLLQTSWVVAIASWNRYPRTPCMYVLVCGFTQCVQFVCGWMLFLTSSLANSLVCVQKNNTNTRPKDRAWTGHSTSLMPFQFQLYIRDGMN